jgi:histidine triad (HIT) family protein
VWGKRAVEPSAGPSAEDRRKHLDFIQSVITRMASAAAVAKGWALTVAVAAFGYAATKQSYAITLLGLGAVVVFGVLDFRYLREERKFRALYKAAVAGTVDVFDMDAHTYCKSLGKNRPKNLNWWRVARSWTVLGYYGVIFLGGLALLIWIISVRNR